MFSENELAKLKLKNIEDMNSYYSKSKKNGEADSIKNIYVLPYVVVNVVSIMTEMPPLVFISVGSSCEMANAMPTRKSIDNNQYKMLI